MSIVKVPIQFRLGVRFNCGLDEEFNTIYRVRSWRGVRPTATAAHVHALGDYLGQICEHSTDSIRVTEEFELEAE